MTARLWPPRPDEKPGIPRPPHWTELALCAETDPEIFYPEKGESTREPKKVCRSCDVRAECLAYALENDERFGVWGGFSERERRRLKRDASGIQDPDDGLPEIGDPMTADEAAQWEKTVASIPAEHLTTLVNALLTEGTSPKRLADRLQVHRTYTGRYLRKLRAAGHVRNTGRGPAERSVWTGSVPPSFAEYAEQAEQAA